MMNDHDETLAPDAGEKGLKATPRDPREAIVEALLELAGERNWEDVSIADVATRANLSLSAFRDLFPSKGAALAAFWRKIDKIVLDGTDGSLAEEPIKERLFDVLMRRLDALAPYKHGMEGIAAWTRSDPIAAAAVNRLDVNSMRFMLEAAGADSEGAVGALKLQGLALAWERVLRVWLRDGDQGLAKTMAALDRELSRGEKLVARAQDMNRLAAPLFSLARSLFERRGRPSRERAREAEQTTEF